MFIFSKQLKFQTADEDKLEIILSNSYIYINRENKNVDVYEYKSSLVNVKNDYSFERFKKYDGYNQMPNLVYGHHIDCDYDYEYLRAFNIHNGTVQNICKIGSSLFYYINMYLIHDKIFIYLESDEDPFAEHMNDMLFVIEYVNGVFVVQHQIPLGSSENLYGMYETKKYIYWQIYMKHDYTCQYDKSSKSIKTIRDKPSYISLKDKLFHRLLCSLSNDRFYFKIYYDKIIVIDQNDNSKIYTFPYDIFITYYCNNKYFCIVYKDKTYFHNMKMQLIKIIDKQVSSIDNKIIVFNKKEAYPIIPLTYKIKKLFVNTSYKHILRMFLF